MHRDISNIPHTQTLARFQSKARGRICTDQGKTENHFVVVSCNTILFSQSPLLNQNEVLLHFESFQINALNKTEINIYDCKHVVCFKK